MGSDGHSRTWREHLGARRCLTQLGSGPNLVARILEEGSVTIQGTMAMARVVWDIDRSAFEWTADVVIIALHFTDVVRDVIGVKVDINDVAVRVDGSATVRIPISKVDAIIMASGTTSEACFEPAHDEDGLC